MVTEDRPLPVPSEAVPHVSPPAVEHPVPHDAFVYGPAVGKVIATVGAVRSTVNVADVLALFPAASVATARTV
jgi:hypothetical protein